MGPLTDLDKDGRWSGGVGTVEAQSRAETLLGDAGSGGSAALRLDQPAQPQAAEVVRHAARSRVFQSDCSRSCGHRRTIPTSCRGPSRNPRLAAQRRQTRESLLQATEKLLAPICAGVAAGRLQGEAKIGLRVGAVLSRFPRWS